VLQKEMYQPGSAIRANMIFATLQGMLPHIYSRNPEISVQPGESVEPGGNTYMLADRFAQTLEIVENRSFLEADLKRRCKAVIRSVQAARIGIVKVSYQRDKFRDPLIQNQMNDAQDNIAHLEKVISDMVEGGQNDEEQQVLLEQARSTYAALEKQVEVVRTEGLVIDQIRVEDFRMDPNLDSIEEYSKARWMAHVTYMRPDKVGEHYMLPKEAVDKLTKYRRTEHGVPQRLEEEKQDAGQFSNEVCAVWEYWDKNTNSVYTWAEGGDQWLREPWQPQRLGQRWLPFFILAYNFVDGMEWPVSDAELLMELQDEYNTVRTQQAEHRELSAPFWLGDKSRVNREDVETFRDSVLGDIALINAGGQPVSQVFQAAQMPPMNPVVYDTQPIRADIEWLSGLGDAQRGSVQRAKTATEATMVEQGLANRVGEKQDTTEDWLTDISRFAAEILLQEMSLDQVQRIAGPNAVWPQANKKQFIEMVSIDIRAGSTGKPDKAREKEQWTQILPLIMQMMDSVNMARMQGMPDEQNGHIQLLEETMRRFDERFDINKLLPPPQSAGGMGAANPQMMQQVLQSLSPEQKAELQAMPPEQQMQALQQLAAQQAGPTQQQPGPQVPPQPTSNVTPMRG
jgi:hypothetical protein